MREIKFRCWSKASKTMQTWEEMNQHGDFYRLLSNKKYPIMQFTGLTDKNGVEIYEGDILLVKDVRICEVIFHEMAGCWDILLRNVLSSLPMGAVCPASYKYHVEVIGNIYENPELL